VFDEVKSKYFQNSQNCFIKQDNHRQRCYNIMDQENLPTYLIFSISDWGSWGFFDEQYFYTEQHDICIICKSNCHGLGDENDANYYENCEYIIDQDVKTFLQKYFFGDKDVLEDDFYKLMIIIDNYPYCSNPNKIRADYQINGSLSLDKYINFINEIDSE
jgi:hypothetical protein